MDLHTTAARVRSAIEESRGILPAAELDFAEQQISEALWRRELVGEHTVVALVGGTGSGKSSLFNALTHSDLAEVGVLRPTTRRPAACTWGTPPDQLLDHLGVEPADRIVRDTLLTHSAEEDLEGLVLLDLPDQDSIREDHASVVDRLVPLVDLLVWLVDPQKYADHVLHERYLGPLAVRSDAMVVAINHADTLTEEGLATVEADVRRILDEGGLGNSPVITMSVPSGEGIGQVRSQIAAAVASGSSADSTARAQVGGVARWLLRRLGTAEPELSEESVAPTVDALVRASGTEAVAESIERSLSRLGGAPIAVPEAPARAAVAAIGSGWAGHAKHGLPKAWAGEVDRHLPSVETLTHTLGAAVESVPAPPARVKAADTLLGGTLLAFGLAVLVLVLGSMLDWPTAPTLVGVALLLGVAGFFGWRSVNVRAHEADAIARRYSDAAREQVRSSVSEVLVAPTRTVLERHRRIRETLAEASASGASG
ncbi:MAG TPA: ATP-binding protein [Actinomycetales bacterium]|nr:ATP-binding protein [Actinomycetales bacterium]